MTFILRVLVFCNPILVPGLLWITIQAAGQNVIPRFETISVNEGLSQSSVYSILQDRKGFMWFGTADGLNRYDGQEIRIFKVASSVAAANSNFVRGQLQEDAGGNIWFSNETGIYYFDALREKIQTAYSFRNNTSAKIYYSVLIDGTDLWLGCQIDGLVRFSMTKKEVEVIPYTFKTDGYHFVTDWSNLGNQILISVSDGKGVYRFDIKESRFEPIFESWKDARVQVDKDRMYLISSDKIDVSYPPYQRGVATSIIKFKKCSLCL
jgi:ligand-binding sensor domain-containing protein